MAALADPATYLTDPDTASEKLRPRTSNRRFLGVLRAIAAWRERGPSASISRVSGW
jgi:ribonuclease D